jgi:hypothetical protein
MGSLGKSDDVGESNNRRTAKKAVGRLLHL